MNIDMMNHFWHDKKGSFSRPLSQYDSGRSYSLLHRHHHLSSNFNARWECFDVEKWQVNTLHNTCSIMVSYEIHVFVWLVIF